MSSDHDDPRDRKTMPVPRSELFDGAGVPSLYLEEEEPDTASQSVLPLPGGASADRRQTLVVLAGRETGSVFTVEADEVIIGRGREADVRLEDPGVSRRHARLFRSRGRLFVEDAGSMNGTHVDGVPLEEPVPLTHGRRIQVGGTLLQLTLQDPIETEVAQRLYESSVRDALTQVFNRRHLEETLRAELSFARRSGTDLSVLMLDIDHFKKVNDTAGHLAGDALLKSLAEQLLAEVRAEDVVARFGGEEFVVLLRSIDSEGARTLAERIRAAVEAAEHRWHGEPMAVTVSIGVATHGAAWTFADETALVAAADEALYAAKEAGRNTVSVYAPPE